MSNTIKIKKYSDVIEELTAGGTITPGMLVELGSADTITAHATAGGNVAPIMIALEDELQGNGINDNYSSGDPVQVWIPYRGDIAYMILEDDETVVIGDELESNGNGNVRKHVADTESFESNEAGSITVYPEAIIGVALEALDLSASSGDEVGSSALGYNKRIRVRII